MRWLVAILLAVLEIGAVAVEPDQIARWKAARLNPRWQIAADKAVDLWLHNQARYVQVQQDIAEACAGKTVPAQVLFVLHMRESDNNFRCHPHEGSPLTHRTRFVPKGRLPGHPPPFTFRESAVDAYSVCDRLQTKDWQRLQSALQAVESFNGLGYQRPGRPASPYLWSGTSDYTRGKYVSDGRFSATAIDAQLGCCAVLLRMRDRNIPLPAVFN